MWLCGMSQLKAPFQFLTEARRIAIEAAIAHSSSSRAQRAAPISSRLPTLDAQPSTRRRRTSGR